MQKNKTAFDRCSEIKRVLSTSINTTKENMKMKKKATTDGIAAWQIDHFLERFLAKKADKSEFWKKTYVLFYKIFDSEYYNRGLRFINKNIDVFVSNATQKEREQYIIDMVYSLHRFGCMFDEYFLYGFPTLNTEGRNSFVTDKIRWSYYARMNSSEANELFNNKEKSYKLFKKYYNRDLILVLNNDDKELFCNFARKHREFIVKPYNSSGGRGVYKVSVNDNDLDACFEGLIKDGTGVVCEELIEQSCTLSLFHAASVNTVRVPTVRDEQGVHLFHPLLRTGVGGNLIDNATGGGIFALVDPTTGIVCTEAKDEKGNTFLSHPNTGVVYPGFQLPDWDNAVKLVNELAYVVPDNHYVGWDLAHTKNGWVMVEGNPRGQLIMMQLFCRNGFKKELESYIDRIQK